MARWPKPSATGTWWLSIAPLRHWACPGDGTNSGERLLHDMDRRVEAPRDALAETVHRLKTRSTKGSYVVATYPCARVSRNCRSCAGMRTLQRARHVAPNDNGQVAEQHGERSADINEKEFHKSPSLGSPTAGQSSNCQLRGQPSDEVRHLRIQGGGTTVLRGIAKSETPLRQAIAWRRTPSQVPAGADSPARQTRSRPSCFAR